MPTDSAKIVLHNTAIAIGSNIVLENINWTVRQNEHWVITGNCGVGKTVLAEYLAYKHRTAEGQRSYPFLGERPSIEQLRQNIRMISFKDTSKLLNTVQHVHYYQRRFNAFDSEGFLTVRQYLEAGEIDVESQKAWLTQIGMYDLLDTETIKLSSGQTRKMLLAKVLLANPKILIIDNPYLGLDKRSRQILNNLLDDLIFKNDITVILSGHHTSLPKCITHRLHIEDDGSIRKGRIADLKPDQQSTTIDPKVLNSIRQYFKNQHPPEVPAEIIRMEDLNIQYGTKQILKDINWRVERGQKWVVYGPNGSGKSTLLSLIYADNPQAYSKRIYLFGRKRGSGESIWEIKRRIGFTSPELHAYFKENQPAKKTVLTGLTDTFELRKKPDAAELKLMKLLFQYFGLLDEMNKPFNKFSTGVQRLLLFMRALIKVPSVLLLDEPFQGLDENCVRLCKLLLEKILTEEQTLIFISHYREEWPDGIENVLDLSD